MSIFSLSLRCHLPDQLVILWHFLESISIHAVFIMGLYLFLFVSMAVIVKSHPSISREHHNNINAPFFSSRQAAPCFLVGNLPLPSDLENALERLAKTITCDFSTTTIGHVPDVSTPTSSFSDLDFASSSVTPLRFALENFATAKPLAASHMRIFEQRLDLYMATEAGIRSEGESLDIVVIRKFLELQIARIKAAQENVFADPTKSPAYLLGEVLRSVQGEDRRLLGEVMALGTQLT
jgi:hypothetical protein